MFTRFHATEVNRILLLLALIISTLNVKPVQANSNPYEEFLGSDGTLNLDGNTLASFQAEDWEVQLDSEGSPIFFTKKQFASSTMATTTIGNWSALGSNLAGTDGAISNPSPPGISQEIDAIAISGTN